MGDRGAGKRSLIKAMNKPFLRKLNKLTAMDDLGSDYSMFDGSYLHLHDFGDELQGDGGPSGHIEDNRARMNVWLINDEDMGHMITKVLTPEDLEYTFAIIMPDLDQPWDIM